MLIIESDYGTFSVQGNTIPKVYTKNLRTVFYTDHATGERHDFETGDLILETDLETYTFFDMTDPMPLMWDIQPVLENADSKKTVLSFDAFDPEHHYYKLIYKDKRLDPMKTQSMWHIWETRTIGDENEDYCYPCQDYYLMHQGPDHLTLTVADGHSADIFCRSHLGARFACEIACEVLALTTDFENIHCIIKEKFDAKVNDDLASNPLSDEERCLLEGLSPHYAYGTTLICAHVTKDGVYRLQIGDGEMHILDFTGKFLPALPDDPNTVDGPSSLVEKDACLNMRRDFTPTETEPAAVILFTDGYAPETDYPWDLVGLLSSHKGLPEEIPEEILCDGNNSDDQTVLMAVNKFHACMHYFQKGLAEERKKLLLQEINELL